MVLMPRAPFPDVLGDARGVEELPVDEFERLPGGDGESGKLVDADKGVSVIPNVRARSSRGGRFGKWGTVEETERLMKVLLMLC